MYPRVDQKTKAIFLMLASALAIAIMQVFVKLTAGEVQTFEQVFARNFISLFVALYMVRRSKIDVVAEMKQCGWGLMGRSVMGFLSIVFYFYAVGHAPQADAAMLNRCAPVFTTFFVAIFLKEKLNFTKIGALSICMLGAYVAMQPSFESNPLPLFSALMGAVTSGVAYTFLAACKDRCSTPTVVLHFSVVSLVLAGICMIPYFKIPSLSTLFLLLMVGVFAAIGQFFLTYGYRVVAASEISIYQFSGVIFTALLSYFIFDEVLSTVSIVGGLIILSGIFWLFTARNRTE